MQLESRAGHAILDRILRIVATFLFAADAIMFGTGSVRFGTWQP